MESILEKNCITCGSKEILYVSKKDGYDFYQCEKCDLIFVYPRPSFSSLSKYYSSKFGYQSKISKDFRIAGSHRGKFIKTLKKLKELGAGHSLLDVGCSNGEFLSLAKQYGFKGYGTEVNEEMIEIASRNELKVFKGVIEDVKFKNNYFSVIHLGDVLEHVSDPVALLRECKRILGKGGIIVISTPNLECIWGKLVYLIHKLFKIPCSILVPPYHLFLFSRSNLEKLFDLMKFKVIGVKYYKCSLRHELGNTGLVKKFRSKKSINNILSILFIFPIYIFIYSVNFLMAPFKKKDFNMTIFIKNDL